MSTEVAPLFDELWDYDHPEETALRLRELLPAVETSTDRSYLVQLLTQIARTHGLQQQYEEAHALLDRAASLLTKDLKVARIRYLLERGRTYNSAGEREKALELFAEAWELASVEGQDFYAIDAAHMLGIAEATTMAKLAWNLKALDLAERTNNERARHWAGSLYNNIGWTYAGGGDFEKALAMFEKALAWHEAKPDQPIPIRIAKWCIGRTLRSLDRLPEALALQQALLAEWQSSDVQDGYVYEELAECFLAMGYQSKARPHFRAAYELLSKDRWLVTNESERLKRLRQLAQIDT